MQDIKSHFLIYTSHREFGGTNILGIFDSAYEAYEQYEKSFPNENDRYWDIWHIEEWQNNVKISEQ